MIGVESVVFPLPDPPPDTLTAFTCGEVAFPATFTVTVIAGKLAPPASASLRVHVVPPAGHVHPVPAIDTSVIPVGTVSVTVTVPLVGPAEAALEIVTVYVAFVCP
jgi:hypothetical protein